MQGGAGQQLRAKLQRQESPREAHSLTRLTFVFRLCYYHLLYWHLIKVHFVKYNYQSIICFLYKKRNGVMPPPDPTLVERKALAHVNMVLD